MLYIDKINPNKNVSSAAQKRDKGKVLCKLPSASKCPLAMSSVTQNTHKTHSI